MEENKMEVFQELIKRQPDFLDRPLEELLPMRFMGEVAVNAYKGLINRLDNLPLAQEEKEAKLKDGQDAGKALLMIEGRIGELLPPPEKVRREQGGRRSAYPEGFSGKDRRKAQTARAIHEHPQEVDEVIREAEENEDIPTKTAVLNKIAYKKELARKKEKREKTQFEMQADAYIYFTKLQEALRVIPTNPPSDLTETDYLTIKAIALIIIKRLEVFQDGTKTKNLSASN